VTYPLQAGKVEDDTLTRAEVADVDRDPVARVNAEERDVGTGARVRRCARRRGPEGDRQNECRGSEPIHQDIEEDAS
jgi:hypothetical protein